LHYRHVSKLSYGGKPRKLKTGSAEVSALKKIKTENIPFTAGKSFMTSAVNRRRCQFLGLGPLFLQELTQSENIRCEMK
jgi:hypothetical protein